MWHPSVFISDLKHTLKQWHLDWLTVNIASISPTTFLSRSQAHIYCVYMQQMSAQTVCKWDSHRYYTRGFYHTFNRGMDFRSYSPETQGKKIDAITARTVTSITSVDLVKSHLLIAHWNIHYHNVSKQLQTQGGVQIDFQQSSHWPRTVSLL